MGMIFASPGEGCLIVMLNHHRDCQLGPSGSQKCSPTTSDLSLVLRNVVLGVTHVTSALVINSPPFLNFSY